MNKQARKEQAVKYLNQLGIYAPYVKGFEERDQVCFYERYAGYWADQEPEVYNKMKAIEKEFNCTVYAITHEMMFFGECYSFLIVTNYKEEWKTLLRSNKNKHQAFAYVWNKSDDWCSELGTITVQSALGGIRRIA